MWPCRKARRSYKDPKTGQLYTAARKTDAHCHLRVACKQAVELSFLPCTLVISEGLQLTECHKNYYKGVRSESLLEFIPCFAIVAVLCLVYIAAKFKFIPGSVLALFLLDT